jgi:hypothetical protein
MRVSPRRRDPGFRRDDDDSPLKAMAGLHADPLHLLHRHPAPGSMRRMAVVRSLTFPRHQHARFGQRGDALRPIVEQPRQYPRVVLTEQRRDEIGSLGLRGEA